MPASAEPFARTSAEDWRSVFALLDTGLELEEPAAQAAWLASLGPEHAHVAPILAELLRNRAAWTGDGFMRTPAIASAPQRPDADAPGIDGQVGPYRLLRKIGEGGMASVWLAVRADGLLGRQVALKLPHAGWGGTDHTERMAREREILAALAHPHIARLYDAGIADDGRPYLALEHVEGEPIDTHAASRGLGVRARLELIVQVARAVAHAHARLIVHRDLKPSNILVDSERQTHLLDFGIAKLLDAHRSASAESSLTRLQGRALTPDYASPEQIRGDTIGTATDIYSLGVVMFELLTGRRPYRLKPDLGPVAMAESLEQTEVPRASTVAGDVALGRQLRGDLDAILARALAKPSAGRYATIDAFADDLERHLRGEPVRARPDSRWYRTERWVRRHKLESAIALGVLIALLGGAYAQVLVVLALGAGATLALWQRNRAVQQAERARLALERAEQVKGFIASIFTQAVPRDGHGGAVTALGLLQAAAQRVETDLASQPEVAAELGALIGASFNELGEVRAGLTWLPRAVELCTRALGPTHRFTLQTRWRLVEAANTAGELEVSEPLLPALVRDARVARPPEPELLVAALKSHGFVLTKRGLEAEAMTALHEAVEVATRDLGEASEPALYARSSLSNTYKHFGRYAEALACIEPVVPVAQREYGQRRPHGVLIGVERSHADALTRNRRPRDAVAMLRQVLADQRALDVGETERVRVITTMLGQALLQCGCFDEAEAEFAQVQAMRERLGSASAQESSVLAFNRAHACVLLGDFEAALVHVVHSETLTAGSSEAGLYAPQRASIRALAEALAGHVDGALATADALLSAGDQPSASDCARASRARAVAFRLAGQRHAAIDAAAIALERAAHVDCSDLERGMAWVEAARCSLAAGDFDAARSRFEHALDSWREGQVDGDAAARVRREMAALG